MSGVSISCLSIGTVIIIPAIVVRDVCTYVMGTERNTYLNTLRPLPQMAFSCFFLRMYVRFAGFSYYLWWRFFSCASRLSPRRSITNPKPHRPGPTRPCDDVVVATIIARVHSNQDLIWCAKIGVNVGFWVHRGS